MSGSADAYLAVAQVGVSELVEKGSRFLGRAEPVDSIAEIEARLQSIRRTAYDATHHCYAWRSGPAGQTFKYSDDGEPNGTAGRPIFDLLVGRSLTNSLVVVTRYFGGTKLGTGPLARAYAESARLALDSAGVKEWLITQTVMMTFDISQYDRWLRMMSRLSLPNGAAEFSDLVIVRTPIRLSMIDPLRTAFTELTLGKGNFSIE